jgi:hypothetical protein
MTAKIIKENEEYTISDVYINPLKEEKPISLCYNVNSNNRFTIQSMDTIEDEYDIEMWLVKAKLYKKAIDHIKSIITKNKSNGSSS